jgi:hypothetical protein
MKNSWDVREIIVVFEEFRKLEIRGKIPRFFANPKKSTISRTSQEEHL